MTQGAFGHHAVPICVSVVAGEFFWSIRHCLGVVPSHWWKARIKPNRQFGSAPEMREVSNGGQVHGAPRPTDAET